MALMKPIHINLAGNKADSSLVNMAYKMKQAATPADMSDIFARMADSYDRTMQANGAMWSNVIKAVEPILMEGMSAWKEHSLRVKAGAGFQNKDGVSAFINGGEYSRILGPDEEGPSATPQAEGSPGWMITPDTSDDPGPRTTTERTMGLKDISEGIRETLNPFKGNPFSQENKNKRRELNMRKKQIFADIDLVTKGFEDITMKLGSNNFYRDSMYTDSGSTRLLNALGTINNPSGKTKDGDYAEIGYNKENRMVFRLFDKNGDPVLKNAKNPRSEQISIQADQLGELVIPKLGKKGKQPFNKLWQGFIKDNIKPNANAKELSAGFKNNMRDLVNSKEGLHQAMHEKHFLNFEGSFIDDLMGTNGKRSDLSATIFQALVDTHGATNGKPNLPTDSMGNPLDIDVSGGTDPTALDEMDFSGDGVGLQNYAKLSSAITNRNSEFYNEHTTREIFLHWATQKGQEKALIAKGQQTGGKIPGKLTLEKEIARLEGVAGDVIRSAKNGDFSNLVLPRLKTNGGVEYGEGGTIKFNYDKGHFEIHQNDEIVPLTGDRDIRTNQGIMMLLSRYGVGYEKGNGRHILDPLIRAGLFKQPVLNMGTFKRIQQNLLTGQPGWSVTKDRSDDPKSTSQNSQQKQQGFNTGFKIPTGSKKSVDDYMKEFGIVE